MFHQKSTAFTFPPLKSITKHLCIMYHMVIPLTLQIRVCLVSFKVIQIINSAVSGEMLQVTFNFQSSVKVTYVTNFFNFKCVLQMFS